MRRQPKKQAKSPRRRSRLTPTPGSSSVDLVLDALFGQIMSGHYLRGARLPAERQMADEFSTSRVTVRQALQRLTDWHVIAVRRGSGAVLCDIRTWTFQALPAVLRYWLGTSDTGALSRWLTEALELRRNLYGTVMGLAAARLAGRSMDVHRERVRKVGALRDRPAEFSIEEVEVVRSLLGDAGMHSSQWLLNSLTDVYLQLAGPILAALPVPPDYVETYLSFLDKVEARDPVGASRVLDAFMSRYDDSFLEMLRPAQVA